jgi:mycothiol system anti-sigma-R factor
MNCEIAKTQLSAYLDGELDRAAVAEFEAHLGHCDECARTLAEQEQLRNVLRSNARKFSAPAALRKQIEQAAMVIKPIEAQPRVVANRYWQLAASIVLAYVMGAATFWYVRDSQHSYKDDYNQAVFAQSLLNSHLRALVAANPVDVVSSNQHVVKPWFAGRVALSPPVADFAAEGFSLVGGRVDYLADQRVAVLTYSHGQHLIDLYFLSAAAGIHEQPNRTDGYAMTPLKIAGQSAWMVTDMDEHESERFMQLLNRSAGSTQH